MCTECLWGNLKECYIQEDTVVDESITLKGPLKELGGIVWCRPDFIWPSIGTTGRPL